MGLIAESIDPLQRAPLMMYSLLHNPEANDEAVSARVNATQESTLPLLAKSGFIQKQTGVWETQPLSADPVPTEVAA